MYNKRHEKRELTSLFFLYTMSREVIGKGESDMEEITVEELLKKSPEEMIVIDIRKKEDYDKGTFPFAKNIPMEKWQQAEFDLDREKTIYILCHTGERSAEYVSDLEDKGYSVKNVQGGYRSYLRYTLERFVEKDELLLEKRAQIERSIIKNFRKNIWRKFTKAINEYELIQEGDKIAVCISGGKDSMLLAKLIQELQRHGKINFEAVFLVMNPGYNKENWSIIEKNAKLLGIPLTVFETDIFDIVADVEKNPCYLCARMRRGYLYSNAQKLGCNKIALGHHFDDVIETILMGMLYSGRIETMMPKLHSDNFENMELIRPLYLVKEKSIKAWRDYNGLHFIQCACRFTEHCATCGGEQGSKRDEMKELVEMFRKTSKVIDSNIFKSVTNVNLQKILGYQKGKENYFFLDDYEERKKGRT